MRRAGIVLAALALALAWLGWFLIDPLPSTRSLGTPITRAQLLAQAVPGFIPGLPVARSTFGHAALELGHVEYLPQRGLIVLAAALIAGAAVGLGDRIGRGLGVPHWGIDPTERLALAFGLGTTALGVVTLVVGRTVGLAPGPVRFALGLTVVAAGIASIRERWALPRLTRPGLGLALLVGPFLAFMALGAMLPTIEFDALEYHFQGPKEFYETGRIRFLPHNVYTSMPFGVEMLHLLGMEVLDDWWTGALVGQLLVMLHAPATAILIAATARRLGSPRAGWFAAIVYLTTPWVYRLGVLPFVEGPLCYYHAALVWAALLAWEGPPRRWMLVGLLAGGAMACKYPALVSAVVPFGMLALVVAVRRRSARPVLAFVAGAAVVMTPWLARNVADTGNPVYPLGYRVFEGRHWDAARDAKWTRAHGPKPVTLAALGASALDVAGRSDWQSPLYLLLAPLALGRRRARELAGYVAYLFLTWWLLTHRLDRFWLPLLPPLAVLAGLGADSLRSRAETIALGALLAVAVASALALDLTELTGSTEWTADLHTLRDEVPARLNPPLAQLDRVLHPGAKVLLVGQASVFYFRRPLVYNTVFNAETIEGLARDRSPTQFREALRRLGVTHIYVDWSEVERYRSPGNYGFTPFVTRARFDGWVKAGLLGNRRDLGPAQVLYDVLGTVPPDSPG